jgi:hypothetical protein
MSKPTDDSETKTTKPKKTTKPVAEKEEKPKRAIIRVKTPHDWGALIQKSRDKHWRRLEVTLQLREWLVAGKPKSLDAANAMLKARGLEEHIEAVAEIEDPEVKAQAIERVRTDEGLCEFSRRPGKPGLWLPANNIKAGFKENWSVLGKMNDVRGSRKAIAEGVFIFCANSWATPPEDRDWIYLGAETALGINDGNPFFTAVSHSVGPKGPVSSIKRHEFVVRPLIAFDMYVAQYAAVEEKLSDDDIADALVHFCEHGLGACRSQGYGKFDLVQVRELESTSTTPASASVPPSPEP